MSKENANLCKCNNCGTVMIDQNPQTGAPIFKADTMKIADMQYMLDDDTKDGFWGCGICETDSYLTDEISEDDKKSLKEKNLID